VIVRGYNITDHALENVSVWLLSGRSCALANLNEEPEAELAVTEGRVALPSVGPKKIVTLRWEIDG
jgi:hypothetical protein